VIVNGRVSEFKDLEKNVEGNGSEFNDSGRRM